MSAISQSGSGVEIGYFDEPVGDALRLAAVVVRRGEGVGMQTIPVFSRRGLASILSFLRSLFRPRLRNPGVESPAFEPLPEGFDSSVGEVPTRMLFSRSMRKVRFDDVDYPLAADGLTTVVLVDDRCEPRRITVRMVTAPTVTRARMDPSLEKSEMRSRLLAAGRLRMATWAEALLVDPAIREFTHGTLPGR